MGQVFAGRYEFVDLLGRGGMGDVWRVWDRRDGVYRAAKRQRQADSASLLRFVRESSTRVEHPHVVAPTGWSAEDGEVLFAMPIVGGGSVAHVIADHGPLPQDWVQAVGVQLLEALHAVHEAGLVHRDVKPANVLLEATGTATPVVRLSDFGIAAVVDEPRLTRAWEVVHTPGYAPPEAFAGADPDPRHDLYAAGVVMVEMLTAEKPRQEGPVVVPEGPLAPLLRRMTAPDPRARPVSAADAAATLAAIPVPGGDDEPVEVFGHLPPWPAGWGPHGPVAETPAPARTSAPAPAPVPARQERATTPLPGPPTAEPSRLARGGSSVPASAWLLAAVGVGLVVAAVVTGVR
ncbi:MAG: serine/threonine-protein kinase [Aeromicrobium sp.]|uniref:serine/threonine-protein kinase n=1 Tax=Aeromicrobium sp. TaxID=1871063 RepID=UPI0039E40D50